MLNVLSKRKILTLLALLTLLFLAIGVTMHADASESTDSKGEIEVYLIAGQSNAVGYGEVSEFTATDERFTNGFDNVLYYGEGEHWDGDDNKPPLEFVPVTVGLGQNTSRVGAEIGIASALGDNGKMNAVIKCAWGGTSIYNSTAEISLNYGTWTSPTYIANHNISTDGNKCGRMYTWFLETVTHGLDMLEADGYTPVIKGIWWMQGEAETGSATTANAYNELLTTLINDMRADLSDITGINQSNVPFVMGEITSNHAAMGNTTPSHVDVVCQAQIDVAAALDNVFVVDTTGLAQQDDWHYTADSQMTIGERFIETALAAGGDIPTAYGVVPKEYADGNTYPLAVFKNGAYLASYSDWNTALSSINTTTHLRGKAKDAAKVEIVLINDFTAGKFDNTSHLGGTLVVDLNGYTLTTSSAGNLLDGIAKIYDTGKICDTNIVFENGNMSMDKTMLTAFGVWSENYPAEKTFSYTFNNVNFGFKQSYLTALIGCSANHAVDTDVDKKLYVNMAFNNCVLDLETNAATGASLFHFSETNCNVIQNITFNGGKIIKSSLSKGSLWQIGSNDSVSFGEYNGHYTALELPSGITPASEEFTDSNASALGSLVFAKTGSETVGETAKDLYELTCLTTKYGKIPTSLASIEEYPFILFKIKGDGTVEAVEGYSMPIGLNTSGKYGAIHYAKSYLQNNEWDANSAYAGQKYAVIFQRRDYTYAKSEHYDNYAQTRGEITIDLNGYTLSQSQESGAQPIFRISSKAWNTSSWLAGDHAPIFPSTINVINGNIETFSLPVMLLQMSPCSDTGYQIKDKIFTLNYNNVTFSLAKGATTTNLIAGYYNKGSVSENDPTPIAPFFTNLNDCTIDLTGNVPAKDFLLFDIAPSTSANWERYLSNTIRMNGGVIKSKYWDNYIVVSNTGTYGSTFKFGKSETTGEYTRLELPNTQEYPSYLNVLDGKDGKLLTFTLTKTEGITKTYILGESVNTKYGYIPHRYSNADDYPYIVISYDKNGNIIQIEGFAKLLGSNNGAFNSAKNAISTNSWNETTGYDGQMTSVILARRDYVLGASEYFDNFSQIRGVVTLDLDGHTLSQARTATAYPLFNVTAKPWGEVSPSTINIINGNLLTYNGSFFKLGMWTGTSSEGMDEKLFTFNLENLTLGLAEGATATDFLVCYGDSKIESVWVGKEKIAPYFFNLTNCVIDLETVKPTSSINLFNISTDVASGNYMSNNINVYGCEFKAESLENINFVTEGNNGSSLTFNKANGGNYATLTLKTETAPNVTLNGGELEFVKISETADTITYRLRPVALSDIDFTLKTSITLESQLKMNVYIPTDILQSFVFDKKEYNTFDGLKRATIDGKEYVIVSVSLPSAEAAKNVELTATVKVGEGSATAKFTFSIPKYAAKLLADDDATETEQTLASDVLAYVKAAYNYFTDYNTTEEIARVNALVESIIGDYTAAPTMSGTVAKDNSGTVTDVTLNLDAKPTIRFYVTKTTVSFYQNGKKLNTVSGVDEKYGAYLELDVYAYALAETITFGDGGSYHISDFLTKSQGASHENLVACFVKYVESAAAYRNSVINK